MVIATAAIAIGFISAPEPPKQPVLENQNSVVIEQQIKESKSQVQKKQSEINISTETEKIKKETKALDQKIEKLEEKQQTPKPISTLLPTPSIVPNHPAISILIPTDEFIERSKKITESLNLFDQLEKNYKEQLNKAEGFYLELLLREYSTKRLAVLDQLIPQIKAILRMPNLPYQIVSLYSELLDILTIKRENNLNILNSPNRSTYSPPSYLPPSLDSNQPNYYIPLPTYSPPTYSPPPSYTPPKTPYEIEYDIKVCNSIGGTYSYGLGCSGY